MAKAKSVPAHPQLVRLEWDSTYLNGPKSYNQHSRTYFMSPALAKQYQEIIKNPLVPGNDVLAHTLEKNGATLYGKNAVLLYKHEMLEVAKDYDANGALIEERTKNTRRIHKPSYGGQATVVNFDHSTYKTNKVGLRFDRNADYFIQPAVGFAVMEFEMDDKQNISLAVASDSHRSYEQSETPDILVQAFRYHVEAAIKNEPPHKTLSTDTAENIRDLVRDVRDSFTVFRDLKTEWKDRNSILPRLKI